VWVTVATALRLTLPRALRPTSVAALAWHETSADRARHFEARHRGWRHPRLTSRARHAGGRVLATSRDPAARRGGAVYRCQASMCRPSDRRPGRGAANTSSKRFRCTGRARPTAVLYRRSRYISNSRGLSTPRPEYPRDRVRIGCAHHTRRGEPRSRRLTIFIGLSHRVGAQHCHATELRARAIGLRSAFESRARSLLRGLCCQDRSCPTSACACRRTG